jgi:hypothetical protein
MTTAESKLYQLSYIHLQDLECKFVYMFKKKQLNKCLGDFYLGLLLQLSRLLQYL